MQETDMATFLENEGLKASDIRTHSARKRSATLVTSCSNGGLSAAAICIKVGWTLPSVQDTHLRYEAGGDRIVGRYVAGLTISVLLFYLKMFLTLTTSLSSRVVRPTLSDDHPRYRNALFGNAILVSQSKQRVVCRTARPTNRIRPTGVPPHVHLSVSMKNQANQLQQLSLSVKDLAPTVVELLKTEMSSRLNFISPSELCIHCEIVGLVESVRNHLPRNVDPDEPCHHTPSAGPT
ncbi:hypothetical protein JG688_00009461 [Phytophthora aleatoria]|uniref:Uncharacterized protein n=1 Tax=Phytophthora aleatoria TaxID=2496075 RepID=A0A8J5J6N0_9STRA|nr:hypothetical protein JG688_00009461 [Phytophthora aleatoria]